MQPMPIKKASLELVAIAEERVPDEIEVKGLLPRLVDDGGQYPTYDLTWEQVQILKAKDLIYYCPSCTRNTINDCVGDEDGGYTAAEYHTKEPLCEQDEKEAEAYLTGILTEIGMSLSDYAQ